MKKKLVFAGLMLLIFVSVSLLSKYIVERRKMAEVTSLCRAIQEKKTRKEIENTVRALIPAAIVVPGGYNRQLGTIDSYMQTGPATYLERKIGSLDIIYEYNEEIQITTNADERVQYVWITFYGTYWVSGNGRSWRHSRSIETWLPGHCTAKISDL